MDFLIVGCGFSGCVIANELAKKSHKITLIDKRNHIGGNCYTYVNDYGIIIHKYGPHIFHTDKKKIWDYVRKYAKFEDYTNRVKCFHKGIIYSLPINLHTINQFFKKSFSPSEAEIFIKKQTLKIKNPANFEEQAMTMVGEKIYEAFFKSYTEKQWGRDPKNIPASILKRLPLRFNYDDNYFNHPYQGMPVNGYTEIFEKLLKPKNIKAKLNYPFDKAQPKNYDHTIFSGPLDEYFNFRYGSLDYRTLDFDQEIHNVYDYQGNAVINYPDATVPFTRITEHKHFHSRSKNESIKKTVIFKEFSREAAIKDEKFYPVRLVDDKSHLSKYVQEAKKLKGISFIGRLGTYQYLDMDKTIYLALRASSKIILAIKHKKKIPVFFSKV